MRELGALGDGGLIGLGLDGRLGLSAAQLRDLAPEAARLGYTSLWTPNSDVYDPLTLCVAWHAASGLPTGVSVMPLPQPDELARAAATAAALTRGSFVLGLGSGRIREREIARTKEQVTRFRELLRGQDVPIYLAALGPQMLRLAGAIADGVALNWCTREHIAWSRERVGRDIPVVSYVRVCVADDPSEARRTLATQILGYALGAPPGKSYRAHFDRMGFAAAIAELAAGREAGASIEALAARVPAELVAAVGYAGPPAGAREAFAALARGLDVAIVRVLNTRPGDVGPVLTAMRTFAPRNAS